MLFFFSVGDYVAVIYDETWWAGQIMEVKDENCSISFMVGKGENRYRWPDKEQKDWIHQSGVFAKFPAAPIPVSTRYMAFHEESFWTVKDCIQP